MTDLAAPTRSRLPVLGPLSVIGRAALLITLLAISFFEFVGPI